jgi:hypothetical protein
MILWEKTQPDNNIFEDWPGNKSEVLESITGLAEKSNFLTNLFLAARTGTVSSQSRLHIFNCRLIDTCC